MHTEEEAKTKWCPFARGVSHSGGNRMAYGSAGDGPAEDDYTEEQAAMYPCLGSACMAWQWAVEPIYSDSGITLRGHQKSKTEGFCGLAGRPS